MFFGSRPTFRSEHVNRDSCVLTISWKVNCFFQVFFFFWTESICLMTKILGAWNPWSRVFKIMAISECLAIVDSEFSTFWFWKKMQIVGRAKLSFFTLFGFTTTSCHFFNINCEVLWIPHYSRGFEKLAFHASMIWVFTEMKSTWSLFFKTSFSCKAYLTRAN